ncbi:MAG TPA: hypothetical protein VKB38_14785 [Terracidiphilus sp.]|nr:hypothetical protein [Terracidiphilus sp.]
MADYSSWMGDVLQDHPEFGDIPVTQMALPGSHDSGTYTMDTRARTQSLTIEEQLKAGLRYFDFRATLSGDNYYIHHGLLESKTTSLAKRPIPKNLDSGTEIFAQIRRFLKANPKEVVILRFGDYWGYKKDQDYIDFVDLIRAYFTIPAPSQCALVRLAHGTKPYVNQQTLKTLLPVGMRVFVLFEVKNVPPNEKKIWDYVFHCPVSGVRDTASAMVLWDPYWEDAEKWLADDDAKNVKDHWFPWHEKNLKSWNRDGFFVLQSQMQVLHPTNNGAPGYFNKAERSARATSKLYKYPTGLLIANNDRNSSQYVEWLQSAAPMNIVTFDWAQYGWLVDKIVAYYRGWKLVPNYAQSQAADWKNKVSEAKNVTAAEAARIANGNPQIGFFFFVKEGPLDLIGKGRFDTGTAVFFSGSPQPGTAEGYADLYVKRT